MLELHTGEPMLWKQERKAANTLCCMQIQQVALFYWGVGEGGSDLDEIFCDSSGDRKKV